MKTLHKIEEKIYLVRGRKIMLDEDLALIYEVETKRLNEQVKRNIDRFPKDFMFQLTQAEFENLKSQNATSSWGGRRTLPYAFTEHGTVMLASILKSKKAINANIQVVRAFVKLRELLISNHELSKKLLELENKYDNKFIEVFTAIKQLMGSSIQDYEKKILRNGLKE